MEEDFENEAWTVLPEDVDLNDPQKEPEVIAQTPEELAAITDRATLEQNVRHYYTVYEQAVQMLNVAAQIMEAQHGETQSRPTQEESYIEAYQPEQV